MFFFRTFSSSLPGALGMFSISLIIVIAASARFTHKLEELCAAFDLSTSTLSLLSALGANVPNYVSSALAIFTGHTDVGIGIIVGSNIYNIAIILGLSTFFSSERSGITLDKQEKRGVYVIACYACAITLLSFLVIFWMPGEPILTTLHALSLTRILLPLTAVVALGTFAALLVHLLRRSHGGDGTTLHTSCPEQKTSWSLPLLSGETIFMLVIALGGVLVMVQSGQTLTTDLRMPSVLAGLLVLAVATSLPNTVVAISMARSGEAGACVEEIYNSGSINTTLGIILPVIFWSGSLGDHLLLFLDLPLSLALMIGTFFCVVKGRITRSMGALLLVTYVIWVLLRFRV